MCGRITGARRPRDASCDAHVLQRHARGGADQGPAHERRKLLEVDDAVALDVAGLEHRGRLLLRQPHPEAPQHLAHVGGVDEARAVHVQGLERVPKLLLELLLDAVAAVGARGVGRARTVRVRQVLAELAARGERGDRGRVERGLPRALAGVRAHHDAERLKRERADLVEVEPRQHRLHLAPRHLHPQRRRRLREILHRDAPGLVAVEQVKPRAQLLLALRVASHRGQPALGVVFHVLVHGGPVAVRGAHAAERREREHSAHQRRRAQLLKARLHLRHRRRGQVASAQPLQPLVLEHLLDRDALPRLDLQHARDQVPRVLGDVVPVRRREVQVPVVDLRHHHDPLARHRRLRLLERQEPAQQHVQHHPRAPHVHLVAIRLAFKDFGRDKVGGAAARVDAGPA
mmetsp:Transcript_5610/g.13110  ORF Transcript_5610/g.13110 Transcript_5610/m.13110 type:complete len:402 (+) Transcript_5610:39-1244(+)